MPPPWKRLTIACFEAPHPPFRRINGQLLVARLTRIVRFSLRPLATVPAQARCTAPITTLPRRPAPTHATRLANPLPRNLGLPAHSRTATEIGTHVQLRVPSNPEKLQRVSIPKHLAFPACSPVPENRLPARTCLSSPSTTEKRDSRASTPSNAKKPISACCMPAAADATHSDAAVHATLHLPSSIKGEKKVILLAKKMLIFSCC